MNQPDPHTKTTMEKREIKPIWILGIFGGLGAAVAVAGTISGQPQVALTAVALGLLESMAGIVLFTTIYDPEACGENIDTSQAHSLASLEAMNDELKKLNDDLKAMNDELKAMNEQRNHQS